MKTLTSWNRRDFTKSLLSLGLVATLSVGCGQSKKNTVNSSNLPSSGGGGGSTNTVSPGTTGPGYGTAFSPQVQQIKSMFPCSQGQRLMQDLNYSTSAFNGGTSGSKTTLYGPFNPAPAAGTASAIYVGRSPWNDLLIATKLTNGSNQILGWNITISMCSYGSGLVSDQRPLSNFQAQLGITIAENTGCGWGDVLSAQNTTLTAAPMQMPGGYTIPAQQVQTTFTVAGCGGGGSTGSYSGTSGYYGSGSGYYGGTGGYYGGYYY